MLDIALRADTHDLLFKSGDMALIDNAERVAQQVKVELLTWLGEWFLDTTRGMPYLERILIKNPNLEIVRQIFSSKIAQAPDVVKVEKLTLTANAKTRVLTVTYVARTEYGLITEKEELGYGR
jgi:hypothetical protein